MKLYKGIFFALATALTLGACSKEDPFPGGGDAEGTGQLLTRSLALEVSNEEAFGNTRAGAPAVEDFTVEIFKGDATDPHASYKYSEMPEILTLPAGSYTARAHYGENKEAAWEEPYFKGETAFVVKANELTDDVEPIRAKLSNVRVTITFAKNLKDVMSDDAKVTVCVGKLGTIDFTGDETRSAYFRHVENSTTLTATFTGTVDGYLVSETKQHDDVQPGNHYKITFRLHNADDGELGDITTEGGLTVDASVTTKDMTEVVDGDEEDELLEDDMRPVTGTDEPGPVEPGPGPDEPTAPAPEVSAVAVDGKTTIDLSKRNDVTDDLSCAFKVVSAAEGGFQTFTVDIESATLTPDELEGVGLAKHLDLVTPGDFEEGLAGMGFPVNIGGMKEAEFNITDFLGLLNVLGPGDHDFVLTITDANGKTVSKVMLRTN